MSEGRTPNLIVVGVPKAGTGSLFAYLSQHPDICPGDEKEIGYFNYFNPLRHSGEPPPLSEYVEHFAQCGDQRYRFDDTPTYSYGGAPVIAAMKRLLAAPRVLLTLRNPVDRLWSAYTFQRELGNFNRLSFEEYVRVCLETKRTAADLVPGDHLHGLYIGFYANYVPLWLDAFGDDMRVLFFDDMARDAPGVMSGVFRWLDIDPDVSGMDLGRRNKTNHPRSVRLATMAYSVKRSMDRRGLLPGSVREPIRRLYSRANSGTPPRVLNPSMRRRLADLYAESNLATAEALRRHGYADLPAWLQPARSRQQAAD